MYLLDNAKRKKNYSELMAARTRLRKIFPRILSAILAILDETHYKDLLIGRQNITEFILQIAEYYQGKSGLDSPGETEMFGFLSDISIKASFNPFPNAKMETPSEILVWFASYVNCILERKDLEWTEKRAEDMEKIFQALLGKS